MRRERHVHSGETVCAPGAAAGGGERGESRRNYDTRYPSFSHFQRPFVHYIE